MEEHLLKNWHTLSHLNALKEVGTYKQSATMSYQTRNMVLMRNCFHPMKVYTSNTYYTYLTYL